MDAKFSQDGSESSFDSIKDRVWLNEISWRFSILSNFALISYDNTVVEQCESEGLFRVLIKDTMSHIYLSHIYELVETTDGKINVQLN